MINMKTNNFLKLYKMVSFLIFMVIFFISQFFYFDYIHFHKYDNIFLWFATLFIGLFFIIIYFYDLNIFYFLSVLPLFFGFNISYTYQHSVSLIAFVFYGIFAVLAILGFVFSKNYKLSNRIDFILKNYIPDKKIFINLLIFIIIFIIAPFIMQKIFIVYDSAFKWYFEFRNDFQFNFFEFLFLFILGGIIIYMNFLVMDDKIKNKLILLLLLFILGFFIKLIIVKLSTFDIKTFQEKILSNSYYFWAQKVESFQDILKNFVKLHQQYYDNGHVGGHPPIALLFYWFLIKIFPDNNETIWVANFIALFSLFTIIPIFYITFYYTKNLKIAYLSSLFYILTPNSAILSVSHIDAIIVVFIAFSLFTFIYGIKKENFLYFILSGLIFGIATYLTFGIWHLLMIFVLFLFLEQSKTINNNFDKLFLKIALQFFVFILGILFIHLFFILISAGAFNYIDSFIAAQKRHVAISRPYEIWSWANFLHWGQYITPAIISLYFLRYFYALKDKIKMDAFSLISIIIILIQFISCTGRAEQQRQWMYLIIFILPVSVIPLFGFLKNKLVFNKIFIQIFSIAIFIWSILIEIFIYDRI